MKSGSWIGSEVGRGLGSSLAHRDFLFRGLPPDSPLPLPFWLLLSTPYTTMLLLLLESAAAATTSASGFLFVARTIFVDGTRAAVGVVGGFNLRLVDVCCCCFHDLCLSWPSRLTSSLRWFRSVLCLCFMPNQARFVFCVCCFCVWFNRKICCFCFCACVFGFVIFGF